MIEKQEQCIDARRVQRPRKNSNERIGKQENYGHVINIATVVLCYRKGDSWKETPVGNL